jgi:hypothetical protein
MSVAPAVVGTVVAANIAGVGTGGQVLIYIAAAILFGLVGLVPLLASAPAATRRQSDWTLVERDVPQAGQSEVLLPQSSVIIDGDIREVAEPLKLAGGDPRWGR